MPIGAAMFEEKAVDYLEFGTGDIRMGTIHLETIECERQTLFAFAPGKPTEIGIKNAEDSPTVDDIEVIFRFTKIESLDVLIGALQEHKEILKKEKEAI
ncbi:MAG: hypothetical protein ABFD82_18310 [Syntrophaceae bacterium]